MKKLTKKETKMLVDLMYTYVLDINLEELKGDLYHKYKDYSNLCESVLEKLSEVEK